MGSSIFTLWGHGQSKSLFLQPRHSHVMRKLTQKKKDRTEIGLPKAIVLAHRINLFWGLNWQGMQATIQQLKKGSDVDFVIGCVDTRKARRAIDKWVSNSRVLYWLDLGNGASSGQFVLGQPKNSPTGRRSIAFRRWPSLPRNPQPDAKEDDQPSCSAAEALTRQEPFINQNLAYQALGMLTQLLRHGSVSYQGGFCNLATGQLAPLPIRWVTAHPSPTVTTVQFTSAKFHRYCDLSQPRTRGHQRSTFRQYSS